MRYRVSEGVSVAPASLAPRGSPRRTRARGTVTRGRLNHGGEPFRDEIAAESRYAPSNSGSSLSRREVRAGASVAIHASFVLRRPRLRICLPVRQAVRYSRPPGGLGGRDPASEEGTCAEGMGYARWWLLPPWR